MLFRHVLWDQVEYIIKDQCRGCPPEMEHNLLTYAVERIYYNDKEN